jgi:hypothetical protein
MTSKAQQYRQLARDFHFMARSLPHGENRTTLLKMAEECERLADQQQPTDLRQEGPMVPSRQIISPSAGESSRTLRAASLSFLPMCSSGWG